MNLLLSVTMAPVLFCVGRSYGGALSAVRAQRAHSATIWAYGRTRDPYFEILGARERIMVTPSGGFARRSTFGSRHGKA